MINDWYKVPNIIVFNIIKNSQFFKLIVKFKNQITNFNIESPTLLIYGTSVKITIR